MLGIDISASQVSELSSMGSAYLAGLGVGIWKSIEEINTLNPNHDVYQPLMPKNLRNKYLDGWKETIKSIVVS